MNFIVTRTDEAAHRTMAGAEETDIMMAQDYQDITGQMIKQVVSVVQEIEEKLVPSQPSPVITAKPPRPSLKSVKRRMDLN